MSSIDDAPPVRFRERPKDPGVERAAQAEGFTAFQARILAGRLSGLSRSVSGLVRPRPSDLDKPDTLPDVDQAARLISLATQNGSPIAIVTDHDADGATSHAIIRTCLRRWGVEPNRIRGYISHRLAEGYGVSQGFVNRMLPELSPGTCIITADQGSTDEARIAILRAAGHCVVVTDHHGIPEEGPPPSAHAVVNPVRADSRFPDRAIAGCHTALLVMAATREMLVKQGAISPDSERVSDLLDYCAIGTVADASSLGSSHNNRIVVQRGLHLMNSSPRPCWEAMRRLLSKQGPWTTSDIAFQLATRINARGRLGDAMLSVDFLCAENVEAAHAMALELDESNRVRRAIERASTLVAMRAAYDAVVSGRVGLCLWMGDDGHSGVHGISASRVVESFGRPTICLSPIAGDKTMATGSIRSTPEVHVRNMIDDIRRRCPALILAGGGHGGAGGIRILRADIPQLEDEWDRCVRECYRDSIPEPQMLTDGDIEVPTIAHVKELTELEPFGRGFDAPLFLGDWNVEHARSIGDGTHVKLTLSRGASRYDAVWFGAKAVDAAVPVQVGQSRRFAYSLDAQEFNGRRRLQLIIRGVDAE